MDEWVGGKEAGRAVCPPLGAGLDAGMGGRFRRWAALPQAA